MTEYADEVVNVSITTTQENNLRTQLNEIKESSNSLSLTLAPHKNKVGAMVDTFKLKYVDKVQVVLDECLQMSSAIIASRFVNRLQV